MFVNINMSTAFDIGICDKIVLDKFQIQNSFGNNHDNIVADGSGSCAYGTGSFGGVLNPLVSDLADGGFDFTGSGLLKAPLSIPEPASDVFPDPPIPPYLGAVKYKMDEGFSTTAYRQTFQQNFDPPAYFPTNNGEMTYFNKSLIQGASLTTIGKIDLGAGVASGVEQNVPFGGQGGGFDSVIYDPFNTRTGVVGGLYTAFGLNKALVASGGIWNADTSNTNVKIEIDYDLTFNVNGGEAQIIIRVRPPPVYDSGVLSASLLEERIIDLDLNSANQTQFEGCRHFLFNPFKKGWKVGTTFEVFIKPTLNNITDGECVINYFVNPAC